MVVLHEFPYILDDPVWHQLDNMFVHRFVNAIEDYLTCYSPVVSWVGCFNGFLGRYLDIAVGARFRLCGRRYTSNLDATSQIGQFDP